MHPLCWLHSRAVQISDHDWTLTFLCTCSYTRIALLAALAPNHALHGPSYKGPVPMVHNDSVYTWVCSIMWIEEVVLRLRLIRVLRLYCSLQVLNSELIMKRNYLFTASHIYCMMNVNTEWLILNEDHVYNIDTAKL